MPIVGDILADRYRLDAVLGVGGMASVYRATDLRLDRRVAVKVLVANLAADPRFAERFNREAGAMAGFSHPNVAAVYDVELGDPATGREPFYVMEYCEGGSLADRLRDAGRLPPAEVVPIIAAVADGLAELHRRGLIHRDIKPANILFAADRPQLADFGIAWTEGPANGEPLTLPGATLGTAPYLSPELEAGGPPSPASDVYALGVTAFLALTGQYPQRAGGDAGSTGGGGAGADAPGGGVQPVSAAAPDLGRGFDGILARALDADPSARPTPIELADGLAAGVEIWGVARPNPGAIGGVRSALAAGSGVDPDAPTRVAPASALPAAAGPAVPPPAVPSPDTAAGPEPAPPEPGAEPTATAVEPAMVGPVVTAVEPAVDEPIAAAVAVPEPSTEPTQPIADAPDPGRPAPLRPRPSRAVSRQPAPPGWAGVRSGQVPAIAALAIVAILAVLIVPGLLGGNAAKPGASASATASTAASPSRSMLPNADAILAALRDVDAAIEAARGGKDGLNGRDANELTQLAADVRTAVDRGDAAAAATATQHLADRAQALVKGLEKQRRERLLAAIEQLRAAVSAS